MANNYLVAMQTLADTELDMVSAGSKSSSLSINVPTNVNVPTNLSINLAFPIQTALNIGILSNNLSQGIFQGVGIAQG